jgi:hypothetical protein
MRSGFFAMELSDERRDGQCRAGCRHLPNHPCYQIAAMKICFSVIALPVQQLLSPAGAHRPLVGHGKRCVRSIWAVSTVVQ